MQTHIGQLTKQRLSDFFVKEDGHVAHKNALAAGTVATGAILASMLLTPDVEADTICGTSDDFVICSTGQNCCSGFTSEGDPYYFCVTGSCPW